MTSSFDMPDDLAEQAAAWVVRVQSDEATGDDWSALTDWLEASPDHLAAFEAAEQAWREVDDSREEVASGLTPAKPTVVPFRIRPRSWAVGAALAAGLAGVIVAPALWRSSQGVPQTYVTAPGELRTVTLADGTQIRMNGASKLTVRLGWTVRRVDMAQAEAAFDVVHDPSRPFVVNAGDETVRVIGTAFNIRRAGDSVVVTVRRGIVAVTGARSVTRLTVGQQLRHVGNGQADLRAQVNPDEAFAWTEGRLVCTDRLVADVVADLNRRFSTPVRVSPQAAARRFTGVLALDDQPAAVSRLAAFVGARSHRADGQFVID